MPGAPLIHWVYLDIAPAVPGNEALDALAGRPTVRRVESATIRLRAQLDWQATESRSRGMPPGTGAAPQSIAVATFSEREMRRAGWTPNDGDRVTAITARDGTTITTDLYVSDADRSGAWPSRDSTWVVKLIDGGPGRKVS